MPIPQAILHHTLHPLFIERHIECAESMLALCVFWLYDNCLSM